MKSQSQEGGSSLTFDRARRRQRLQLSAIRTDPELEFRLAEIGFCENAALRKVVEGCGQLCALGHARYLFHDRLAEQIDVAHGEDE